MRGLWNPCGHKGHHQRHENGHERSHDPNHPMAI
jgi:hypothetical protein